MPQIDALFDELLARKGSDLHLGAGHPPLARCSGELTALREHPVGDAELQDLLHEILGPADKERLAGELDLTFAHVYEDKARFRASYFFKTSGLAAVFHLIPWSVPSLDELGCPEPIRKLVDRRAGLVLVAGPAGSGKTTTLASMVDQINRTRACHVLTIESPVEFVHRPNRAQVTHREVGPDAVSYAAALRSAAREDADVVLVGELETHATMKPALALAGSGVLVLGAARSSGASTIIERILDDCPAAEQQHLRGMLAESLAAILVQQLVKTADGTRRLPAHEILLGSSALSSMIRDGKTSQVQSLMQAGGAVGMQTMDTALERLVQRGAVSADDASDKASDKENFQRLLARRTGPSAAQP